MAPNPTITGFTVDFTDVKFIGRDLQRPECILAEPDGTLWSADARGGVVRISVDGSQEIITQTFDELFKHASDDASRFSEGTLPNGLAFAENHLYRKSQRNADPLFSVAGGRASHGALEMKIDDSFFPIQLSN